jgi:Spy/CpxP family protein refolding chaperone
MVNLRKDQQKSMDAIFNANKPAIIATYKTFEKEQANLNSVSGTAQVDKSQMFAAIDRVNQARAALEKANTEMLLQIRNQLDPAQIAKLESIP